MNIISIDFSKTSTGIYTCTGEGEENSYRIVNPASTPQEVCLSNVFKNITMLLENEADGYDIGLIEGYGYNPKNRNGLQAMAEIAGVIKLAFIEHLTPLVTMPIQTWKSLTIGKKIKKKGNEKAYLKNVLDKYIKEFATTDEADAYLFYRAAVELFNTPKLLTEAQQNVKEKIYKIIGDALCE